MYNTKNLNLTKLSPNDNFMLVLFTTLDFFFLIFNCSKLNTFLFLNKALLNWKNCSRRSIRRSAIIDHRTENRHLGSSFFDLDNINKHHNHHHHFHNNNNNNNNNSNNVVV